MNAKAFQFFLQFHHGTPRQGPGTPEATADAFRRIQPLLPPAPAVLDLACGTGGQTLTLASLTAGTLHALDSYLPFVEEARRRLAERGLGGRVTVEVGDMTALALPPARFDLVWCEGALFVPGFERGLEMIRPLLRGPGLVVASEATWLRPLAEVSPEVRAFWAEAYPPMTDVEGNLALARRAGYTPLDHFTLPAEGWDAYVDAVERRMEEVLALHPGDPDAEEAARAERREFAVFRGNRGDFGYEFFLLQRS